MNSDWFLPGRLAGRLARGQVTNREVAMIMLANLVLALVVFHAAFVSASPAWTLSSLIEFAAVLVITLVGFTRCFDAAGGDANDTFARQFNCLSFGVWFWVTLVVWALHWVGIGWFRGVALGAYEADDTRAAAWFASIGGYVEDLWTLAAVVIWQIAYFGWLSRCLAAARGGARKPLEAG